MSDRALLRDLIAFLREGGCIAEQASAVEADVFVPAAPNERAARTEVRTYISAWRIKSGGDAAIVEK